MATALTAVKLLGRWTQLAGRHVALGAGCSCGAGLPGLRLRDFEQQILAYLRARHGEVVRGSVAELLREVAKAPAPGARGLLRDLARSLDSFDELHRISPAAESAPRGSRGRRARGRT